MDEPSIVAGKRSEKELIPFLIRYACENNISLAIWRLPNSDTKHIILSQQHQYIKSDRQIEDLPTGFVFTPFDKEKERIFLSANFSFSFEKGELKSPSNPLETDSIFWLNEQLRKTSNPLPFEAHPVIQDDLSTEKSHYLHLVEKAVSEIAKGMFEKIVPSRRKIINLPPDFDIATTLQGLCNAYPNAMISFVRVKDVGTWLGASPELLVQVEDKAIFKTIALAGTKPFDASINTKSVAWTQKEIEEQALVERYIISCFKKIRLREYDEQGPKTIIAGNLMHLRSDFTVDIRATGFPLLGSTMLQLLHPTSAVCGMPLEPSFNFLKEHEGYEREFYAGYLGPVNFNNSINIFVNLRCMKIIGDKAICFAGAGVTKDSDPEAEWAETELKCNTLLNIVFNKKELQKEEN